MKSTSHNHFFYWLFVNTDFTPVVSGAEKPLIIYMNGGPGSTSMNALFMENGPLRVSQRDPEDLDSFKIVWREADSWLSLGDLLFIDQPVGTGWSYGSDSPTSLELVGTEFVTFMLNFYKEFPAMKKQELILTGESFAGKYLSFMSQAILNHNNKSSTKSEDKILFDKLALSNPLVVPEIERMH